MSSNKNFDLFCTQSKILSILIFEKIYYFWSPGWLFFCSLSIFRDLFWIFDSNIFSSKNVKNPKGVPRGRDYFGCRIRHNLTQNFKFWTFSHFLFQLWSSSGFWFLLLEQQSLVFRRAIIFGAKISKIQRGYHVNAIILAVGSGIFWQRFSIFEHWTSFFCVKRPFLVGGGEGNKQEQSLQWKSPFCV